MKTILILFLSTVAAFSQYGPASLLNGGTNNVGTNYVLTLPDTAKITLGQYNTVGLHVSARTVAAATTNGVAFALRRSLDGTTYESNLWQVLSVPLTSAAGATNLWLTNVTVGPFLALRFDWVSNQNANANATNCLTNLTLKYLLKD